MDVKSLIILKCFCLLTLYFNPLVEGDIPYGFCANPECSVPVSNGIAILRYNSPDNSKISVEPNEVVDIYVKEYGPKKDLWGVIVKGNRGYISKNFIRETHLFVKRLVPALSEFKTSLLVTDSSTMSSHLHVSSQHLQSNSFLTEGVPESFIHSETIQQDLISSPSSFQQKWSSPSENLQASHLSPSSNPSDNVLFNSKFDPSSKFYDVSEQSSHFHVDSGSILSSSHISGMKPENILPSPTPVPNVRHSPFYDNSLNDIPHVDQASTLNFPQDENFGPNSISPSQTFQSINQHLSLQQQQLQSPHVPEMHSSFYSENFDPGSDEDMAKTFSMLSDLGFDNTDMFDPYPKPHVQSSSQNVKNEFGFSETELNSIPSQSQYTPFHSSDASFYPSVNSNPQIEEENKVKNSDTSGKFVDINKPAVNVVTEIGETSTEKFEKENMEEENNESDLLAEIDEGTDEDDEEVDESLDPLEIGETLLSNEVKNSKTGFNVEPSMSSMQNIQPTSEVHRDFQSSLENSILDSNLAAILSEEHTPVTENEQTDFSLNELTSSNINFLPSETKISEDVISQSSVQSSILESTVYKHSEFSDSVNVNKNSSDEAADVISNVIGNSNTNESSNTIPEEKFESVNEPFSKKDVISDVPERNNNDAFQTENNIYNEEHTTPKISDFFVENEKNSDLDKILNSVDIDRMGDDLTTYQVRNLKGEFGTTEEQQSDSDVSNDENLTQPDSERYNSFENWLDSLKSVVDFIMSWIPEPLYSALMDLQNKGISPRVPVFTALSGFISIFLIVPIFYIKEWSKENRLSAQLASVEKKAYTLSATNIILEEKLESVQSELATLQASLTEEKSLSENLKIELENQLEEIENTKAELESCLQVIDSLKEKENEYLCTIQEQEKEIECFAEHKDSLDKIMKDQENSISDLTDQLQENENRIKELENEKVQFLQVKEDYEEKLAQFDQNCNQLLQEAEVWNLRVQELTTDLDKERTGKTELLTTLKVKDEEIDSLKQLVETFKAIDDIEDPDEQTKTKEEKLKSLMDASMIVNQLKQEEEKNKLLDEQLGKEKNKILDMEVELLEAKSEIDKLKINYNQALQDKAEAQTKLDVLTNYFKDKEIQLQKQLGAQEAVRQKKEEDANSAERRICLIEQENASYKYQVASMKQEMEETERNLKSQIAVQEKKAHENWIAARAAERKLEDMKQEVTQLRQRLTLLEREQENWANTSRDEIIRPVPKRMPGVNDESGNQDLNTSERRMFPLPPMPPMMLPPDRPLPPLPPPPMFLPPMERHYRPQPWHIPPDHSSDYRTTPPEFMAGRESTPPRGRQSTITDGDTGMHTSSPLTTDTRDSQNSTPPHLLPDFHDVPPQPGRPFFPPPPLGHARLPMHPPYRRDAGGPGPKRLDNPNDRSHQPPQQEHWQHSRV